MSKKQIWSIVILAVVVVGYIVCCVGGEYIYKWTTPQVEGKGIGSALWDNKKYHNVIDMDDLYEEDGSYYIYLIKPKTVYWYTTYYVEREQVNIISINGEKVAIEFTSAAAFENNMIVSEFMGSVEEYSEVYVRLKNTITS